MKRYGGFLNNKIYVYVVIHFRDSVWCFQMETNLCRFYCMFISVLPLETKLWIWSFVQLPIQDLNFQRHKLWSFVFKCFAVKWLFGLLYWWNCWPILYKLSFHTWFIYQSWRTMVS